MLATSPIDFNAIRKGLSLAMQQALGLDQNSVVMAEPEQPVAKRPELPFADFMVTSVAQPFGRDSMAVSTANPDYWTYSGPRQMTALFRFYGETHEQAYGMGLCWQAALAQEPTCDLLGAYGVVVWRREAVVNTTSLLSTGYEGRAALNATFGLHSSMDVRVGSIEHVPVSGVVDANQQSFPVIFTADLQGQG